MQLYIDEQLASIKTKLQQVLKQYQLLRKENWQLKKELEKLKEEASKVVASPVQEQTTVSIASSSLSEKEKAALNKKIDGYLKEIDKCIALINP